MARQTAIVRPGMPATRSAFERIIILYQDDRSGVASCQECGHLYDFVTVKPPKCPKCGTVPW